MNRIFEIQKIFKDHEFVEVGSTKLHICFNRECEYFFLNKSDLLTGILVESESLTHAYRMKDIDGVGFKLKTVNDLNSLLYIL